ncbi:MAG TPA: RCC1 domain-containing protein, partial [Polyangiaceae bacterium]|nr:RCC1 domain-containing protein [Polyangiaceae bacterium]
TDETPDRLLPLGGAQASVSPGRAVGSSNSLALFVSGLGNGSPVVEVATFGNTTSCARNQTDQVFCWGANTSGQVGNGAAGNPVPAPAQVAGFP